MGSANDGDLSWAPGSRSCHLRPDPLSVLPTLGEERIGVRGLQILGFLGVFFLNVLTIFFTRRMIRSKSNIRELSVHEVSLLGLKI